MNKDKFNDTPMEAPISQTPHLMEPRFLDGFVSTPRSMEGVSLDVVKRIKEEDKISKQPSFKFKTEDGFKAFSWAVDDEGYRISPEDFFEMLPPNSIATIPVHGAIQERDMVSWWSGRTLAAGSATIGRWVQLLDANPNVVAIKFDVDSPGGDALGNETLNNLIKSCNTVTGAHARMMASAAYYGYCSCDLIAAKEEISIIGSIGVMMTMARRTGGGYMGQMGYEIKEVYSSYSGKKNAAQREFQEEGTTEKMVAFLDSIAMPFISAVKKNRKIKDDGSVFQGEIYTAKDALKIGLIDSIESAMSFDERLLRLAAKRNKTNAGSSSANSIKLQAQHMSDKTEELETETPEQPTATTTEELKAEIEELKAGLTGLVKADTANDSIKKANSVIATLKAEKEELKAEAVELTNSVNMLNQALQAAQKAGEEFQATIKTLEANLATSDEAVKAKEQELDKASATIEKQDEHAKQLGAKAIESNNTPPKVDTTDVADDKDKEHKVVTTADLVAEADAEVEALFGKKG